MADRDVGGIVGHLRLDKSDWDLALSQAGAKADDLSRKSPNIRVTATTGEALAQLEAVAVAAGRLQDAQGKVAVAQQKYNDIVGRSDVTDRQYLTTKNALLKATRDEETAQIRLASAYQQVDDKATRAAESAKRAADAANKRDPFTASPLAIGAAAIGPAAVPLAAVGAGALLGLAPLAATAILAFVGISNAMKASTAQSAQFSESLNAVKSGLTGLEQTAANGVMTTLSGTLGSVAAQFGPLNADVAIYSTQLGMIAGNVLPGLLALMHDLSPLFQTFGTELIRGSADFDKWASSTGAVTKFVAYVQAELPTVERVLVDLSTTVSHLLQALAPMGGTALTEIGLLSRAINAIPINVLQVLVPLVVDGYLAFKAYDGLSTVGVKLDKLTTSFQGAAVAATETTVAAEGAAIAETEVGVAAEAAAVSTKAAGLSIGAMLGPVGAVITGVGLLAATFLGSSTASLQTKADIDALTSAIERDNYAIGDNTRQTLANSLVKSGAVADANELGISTQKLSDAVVNGGSALSDLQKQLQHIIDTGDFTSPQVKAAEKLQDVLKQQNGDVNTAAANANAYKATLGALGVTTDTTTTATLSLANAYKDMVATQGAVANGSAQGLIAAMNTFSSSAGDAASKAALLGAVLVASQGDALSYSSAIARGYDAFNQLTITFQQQTKDTQLGVTAFRDTEKAAIDLNTGLIDLKATGAAPLVQQLQAMQSAAEGAAEATYQHELSTKGSNQALQDAQTIFEQLTGGTLVANARQLGLTADQAQKLADQYFSFDGKTVTTTVQSIGLNDVNDTLDQVGQQLAVLTGHPWVLSVKAQYDAQVAALNAGHLIGNQAPEAGSGLAYAAGGPVTGPGSGTSDSVVARLSAGEYVMPADKAAVYRPMLDAMRSGVAMPASPAGHSFQANYTAQPQYIVVQSVLDGKVIAQSVNEVNMQAARR